MQNEKNAISLVAFLLDLRTSEHTAPRHIASQNGRAIEKETMSWNTNGKKSENTN